MPTLLTGLIQFLFTSVMSILGVLLLLRAWVYVWAFSPRHPIVQLARRATDWLVEPLSKLIPRSGSYDWPSLVAALVAAVIMVLMQRVLTGMPYTPIGLVIAPLATVLRWALEMMSWGVFIWVVMTWLNPQSPMTYALGTLVDPFAQDHSDVRSLRSVAHCRDHSGQCPADARDADFPWLHSALTPDGLQTVKRRSAVRLGAPFSL